MPRITYYRVADATKNPLYWLPQEPQRRGLTTIPHLRLVKKQDIDKPRADYKPPVIPLDIQAFMRELRSHRYKFAA